MGLGLLLGPALAGYLFLSLFNGTRYRLARESGYHLIFRSALVGAAFFFAARVPVLCADRLAPRLAEHWKELLPFEYSGTVAFTFMFAVLLPPILNRVKRFRPLTAQQRAATSAGDQISLIIDRAMVEQLLVELTLNSGKSYIGSPVQGTFGHRDDGDVGLVPFASGYRNRDTQALVITTYYALGISELLSDQDLEDLKVAFPLREILSARLFYPNVYSAFLAAGRPEDLGSEA